jgi:hypothetical protein
MAGGRPSKTLLERVLENNFRPKRHAELLAGPALPAEPPMPFLSTDQRRVWQLLRDWQRHWKDINAGHWSFEHLPKEEHLVQAAGDFADLVRWLHGAPKPALWE